MSNRIYDPITPRQVAFLGLGVMGYPMAGRGQPGVADGIEGDVDHDRG